MVSLVLACNTAKDVWERLKETHSQQSESGKMLLYQQFYSVKMQPGSKVSSYVAETEMISKKLCDVGVRIEDETFICKIVSGLTPEFKHFMSNWMVTPKNERTYANLLPRLLAEESMFINSSNEEPIALKASVKNNRQKGKARRGNKGIKDIECFHCKRKGHLKRDCRTLKREQEQPSNTGTQQLPRRYRVTGTNGSLTQEPHSICQVIWNGSRTISSMTAQSKSKWAVAKQSTLLEEAR